MPVEDMVKYSNEVGLMKDNPTGAINSAAQLGIGSPPSGNNNAFSWTDLLCPLSGTIKKINAKYNILNVGGWGPGDTPILWQKSDIPSDNDVNSEPFVALSYYNLK